jgi:hypothetical protein
MSPQGTKESPHATEATIPRPLQPTMNQDTRSPFRQPQREMAKAVALGIMALHAHSRRIAPSKPHAQTFARFNLDRLTRERLQGASSPVPRAVLIALKRHDEIAGRHVAKFE